MSAIEIPYTSLEPEVLRRVLEEFVMREGTDYGHSDYSLSDKVADVERMLKQGKAVIVFDPKTESCDLLTKHQWIERQAREQQE